MVLITMALYSVAFTSPTLSGFAVQRASSTPVALRHRVVPAPLLQATPPPTTPQPAPDEQQEKLVKLLVSILIDLIGVITYAVPAIGEVGDVAWAPISALLIYNLYGNGLVAGSASTIVTGLKSPLYRASNGNLWSHRPRYKQWGHTFRRLHI